MSNTVVFRKGFRIGQPDAESDGEFLFSCFLDNGTYDLAVDTHSRQSVLLGRTGAGKSAIMREIANREENVISIEAEDLSLSSIANSSIIKFYESLGLSLDAFYVLLWKHILSVELIRKKFDIRDEVGQRKFMTSLNDVFRRDKTKKIAIEYLRKWGDQFWINTEYRVTEFTRKLENKLQGSAGLSGHGFKSDIGTSKTLSDEEKGEIVHYGKSVVDGIQVRELSKVIDLLSDDIFTSNNGNYYVCIDKLDEDWAPDDIRFKLLKALLETIKAFQKVRSVKIIIGMRTDLIYSLYKNIKSPGFQSEKYSSYNLDIKWNRADLIELLNKRVSHCFRYQYTGSNVNLKDIIVTNIYPKTKSVDYIIERTFFRPREVISFFNKCLEKAEGKTEITSQVIKDAEAIYSSERLTALCDEWRREYPHLRAFSNLLRGFHDGNEVGSLKNSSLEAFCLSFPSELQDEEKVLASLAENAAIDVQQEGFKFLREILTILYRTGLAGLKMSPSSTRMFSFDDATEIHPEQITLTTKVYVHKTFWSCLSIVSNEQKSRN